MKTKSAPLFITLALGLGLIAVLLWLLDGSTISVTAAPSDATPIRYVAITGTDSGDCSTPGSACLTIQYAVDRAGEGDEIRVAASTYTGVNVRPRNDITTTGVVTQVVYISKTVIIRGGYTTNWITPHPEANPTTLDAQGHGRVLYITGDISPTIEGLRITGGDATGLEGTYGGYDAGGGVYIITATITISNCRVFSNTVSGAAAFGGGMCLYDISNAMLSGNTISGNTVSGTLLGKGGGVYLDRKWLSRGIITLSGNTISSNTVSGTNAYGGGVSLFDHDASLHVTTLSGNTISSNTVSGTSYACGGGVTMSYSGATLSGNTISGNTVSGTYGGGGVCLMTYGSATLINNIIADNWVNDAGSGLYIKNAFPHLLHTTVARNSGGDGSGIYVTGDWGSVSLTNTVLVSHVVGIYVDTNSTIRMEGTLWGSGVWANNTDWSGAGTIITGTVNVWSDPAFVDPANGNYHIGPGSAAIDRGVDAGVATDIDGEIRDASPDLGADEWLLLPNQPPYTPHDPVPADGAVGVSLNQTLSWQGGDSDGNVVTYTVAFGDINPPPVVGQVDSLSYDPGLLNPSTIYYWRIAANDGTDESVGPLWSFTTVGSIAKSVMPVGQVEYGQELIYTVLISDTLGAQLRLYDPLTGTTFLRFLAQPPDVEHVEGVITGTLTVTPTNQITVSFVAKVGVPGTAGWTVDVTNRACVFPFSGTLGGCIWSNEVTNPAFQPYSIYLPVALRNS